MKEFIPFEEAVSLKHLGFDYDCFSYLRHDETHGPIGLYYCYDQPEDLYVLQPTFSQAFRFFRDKYNLHSYIEGAYPWFRFYINSEDDRWEGYKEMTYEEAELECIRKLIQIVKQKQ
jgi:hypothetical protein